MATCCGIPGGGDSDRRQRCGDGRGPRAWAGAVRLPASPRAWLDAYEAAAIDNPSRVCSELFSPQLAEAYGRAMRGSCASYFARITSFSVVVRRVLQDGDTAVLIRAGPVAAQASFQYEG